MIKLKNNIPTVLVTGSAGFIGFHICKKLLANNWRVVGLDCFSDYYDISLKNKRETLLLEDKNYSSYIGKIEKPGFLFEVFEKEKPEVVIHLAAQAGVRHSIENPRLYLESNIIGTFELLEAAKRFPPKHMLLASTSSTYGANLNMPYLEIDKTDHQISFYASTKKSMESIAHSYAHLFEIPVTIFRFFTVYGPWGRPDMAYYKFTEKIYKGEKIDVYNNGNMKRDFTYIEDLCHAIFLLISYAPSIHDYKKHKNDSISPVAPYRLLNLGNSNPVKLIDFINTIEKHIGIKAKVRMMPIQRGDVTETWASTNLLEELTGYKLATSLNEGIKKFIDWFVKYNNLKY